MEPTDRPIDPEEIENHPVFAAFSLDLRRAIARDAVLAEARRKREAARAAERADREGTVQ